ncbi:MAG: sporulation integral membrane protein YtvI [Lachnospiraceae bacterium]
MSTSAKKYLKAVINLIIAAIIVILAVLLLPRVLAFFMPFVIGWIIAWIAAPLVSFFEKKLKIRRKAGSAVVIVVVIGLVVLAGYAICAKLIREGMNFVEDLPELWASMQGDLSKIGQKFSVLLQRMPADMQNTIQNITQQISEVVAEAVGKLSSPTIAAVGNFAKQLPAVLIGIIMCLLSAYFFVSERDELKEFMSRHLPESFTGRYLLVKKSLLKAVGGYFKAQFKIEIWIYLILSAGFFILQVNYALLIALGIACLDFLPFFGTGTVMVPWAIIKLLNAEYPMTIGLLLLWGISQLVRQIIQPKIVGDSVGMPPIPTLLLLYIGYRGGGVFGMIIAVPVGIILWTMYEEGLFDTTKNSIQILVAGLNRFRKLTPQDTEIVTSYEKECEREIEKELEKEHDVK